MTDTKEKLIQSLTLFGKLTYYTGGLKIVTEEQYRQGKVRTIYKEKLRRLHPNLLLISIFYLITQGINREVLGEIKDLYTKHTVWF